MIASNFIQSMFGANTMTTSSKAGKAATGKGDAASAFAALMGTIGKGGKRNLLQGASALLKGQGTGKKGEGGLAKLSGHALVARLKQQLQSGGASLDQLAADGKALASLEKFLVGAGFDADQVRNLLGDLKANANGKGVSLSALFKGISQLDENAPEEYGPEYLEISALPYVETILAQLGLSPNQSAGVLAKAKVEGKGIDVLKLAAGLRQLQPSAGNKSNMMPLTGGREKALDMLQRIGLVSGNAHAEDMDIDRLIMALEKHGEKISLSPDAGGKAGETGRLTFSEQNPFEGVLSRRGESGALDTHNGQIRNLHNSGVQQGSVPLSDGLAGTWEEFLHNIKEVSGERRKELPADGNALTRKSTKVRALRRDTVAQTKAGSNHQNGNNGLADNNVNPPGGRLAENAMRALGSTPGEQGEQPERTVSARSDSRGFGTLLANSEAANKSDDPTAILSDGTTRRPPASESVGDAAPRPAARTVPTYMLDQVSRQILRSRLLGESEIQLQLKPPSLGRLKMSIENTTNGLKVSIIAESAAARDMLVAHANELRNSLAGQGLQLDKIDVETQPDFNQTMADARQGSNQSGRRNRSAGGNSPRGDGETVPTEDARQPAPENNDGVLNLVA